MDFSDALKLLKRGDALRRSGWDNPKITVRVQFPDSNSKNTEPYLYMEKVIETENTGKTKRFPLGLSCESLFAEDWEVA